MEQEKLKWVDYKTIRKAGGSLVVGLPTPFIKRSGIEKGDRVKIVYTEDSLTITKVQESTS